MKKESFYPKLFALVLPLAFQNLMNALVGASDALMLGLLEQDSLSAVSLATQIQFILSLFIFALINGTTVLAAQFWGKNDTTTVEKVLAISLRASLFISAIFFLLALTMPQMLMNFFTNDPVLITLGIPYLRIVGWSYLFSGFSQIFLCIMKNSNRTLKSTIYGSVAVVLNLILNALLIFGLFGFPKLGIIGAAIATVIAKAVELLLCIFENIKVQSVNFRFSYFFHPEKALRQSFWHYTIPILANQLAWGCGFTMFSVIMGHLGNDAVAANSLANIVKNIIACVCYGISSGTGIIVGNELGSGNLETAKAYGNKLTLISFIVGVASGLILLLCSPLILLFADTLTVQARTYLKYMLFICSYYMIGKSINCTVIGGIFCAGGDTRFGLKCDFVNMWLIIIPLGLLAAFVLHLPVLAVYFILNLDELIKLPVEFHHYKKYLWVKNLTGNELV